LLGVFARICQGEQVVPAGQSAMLAEDVAYVVGVDTHTDQHALVLVEAIGQRRRRALTIVATRRGYRQALRLVERLAPGARVWALEGSGAYGAGLARFLSERGERVLEVERPAVVRGFLCIRLVRPAGS
jgi:transposase